VIADPPYEERGFMKYGQRPFNKSKVVRELGEILEPGSCLAWLDVVVPIWSKKVWNLMGVVGVVISTNTRMRVLMLLQKR